jgi:glycosyltransferase involved in cell wall biosynthesis
LIGDARPTRGSISACLVVRNEEAMIERCLGSLADIVDEIVLVHDGECEDKTLEIAERYGCRVFVRPLVGHSEASTVFAYEQARSEWILGIDADEFLSPALRERMRELACDKEINGYDLFWPSWDGERYITRSGPYKLAFFRRQSAHLLGMIHAAERVDPPVVKTDLQLEHRPAYNNFRLSTVLTKWKRWAKINAAELLMPFEEIPKFNWDGPDDWGRRRRLLNRLSPLLFLPYMPVVTAVSIWRERNHVSVGRNVRMAVYQGIYASMVQWYVALYSYVPGALLRASRRSAAMEPPRPEVFERSQ